MAELDRARRRFQTLMKLAALVYLGVGAFFFACFNFLETLFNLPQSPQAFWVALATSMMAMLAYLSWESSKTPDNRPLIVCHLLSKSVSVLGFLTYFVVSGLAWGYLVGAVVDGGIIVVIASFYRGIHAGAKST